jgi:hypothetical protein
MESRRDIGFRVAIGIVGFDLLAVKLALDSADHVTSLHQLTWVIRIITVSSFIALSGMLFQIEVRNRLDRAKYTWAELTREAMDSVGAPPAGYVLDSLGKTIRNSWAATWTVAGAAGLTIAFWWLAALVHVK